MYRLFVEGPKEFPILIGRRPNKQKAAREAKSLLEQYKKAWVEDEEGRRVYSCWITKDGIASRGEPKRTPTIIKSEEAQQLIDACPDTFIGRRNRMALVLMFRCGLRVSDVCNLADRDVDLENCEITVRHGKGDKQRMVDFGPITKAEIESWLATRKAHKLKYRSVWFLVTRDGKKCCTKTFREAVRKLSEQTGIYVMDGDKRRKVHPHVLRHVFATDCVRDGVELHELQDMLGHASLNTTQVYLHVRRDELKKKMWEREESECKL